MSDHNPVKYPFFRYIIYSASAFILIWIIVSMTISIGFSVFWEHKRENMIPAQENIKIESANKALECLKGIEIFDKELQFYFNRAIGRFKKQPMQSYEMWDKWFKQWKVDYNTFGVRYGFIGNQRQNSKYEKLAMAYKTLEKLSGSYGKQFEMMNKLTNRDQKELIEFLNKVKIEYSNAANQEK